MLIFFSNKYKRKREPANEKETKFKYKALAMIEETYPLHMGSDHFELCLNSVLFLGDFKWVCFYSRLRQRETYTQTVDTIYDSHTHDFFQSNAPSLNSIASSFLLPFYYCIMLHLLVTIIVSIIRIYIQ